MTPSVKQVGLVSVVIFGATVATAASAQTVVCPSGLTAATVQVSAVASGVGFAQFYSTHAGARYGTPAFNKAGTYTFCGDPKSTVSVIVNSDVIGTFMLANTSQTFSLNIASTSSATVKQNGTTLSPAS